MTSLPRIILRCCLCAVIEKYTGNVRFCLICNYLSKIIPALQSRCTRFRFGPLSSDQMVSRLEHVIQQEGCVLGEGGAEILASWCVLSLANIQRAGDSRWHGQCSGSCFWGYAQGYQYTPGMAGVCKMDTHRCDICCVSPYQSTAMGFEEVTENSVYTCTGQPLPTDIAMIVEWMLNESFMVAYQSEPILIP